MLLFFMPALALAGDVSGRWILHLKGFGEQFAVARIDLKADGTKVTGTLNELTLDGTVDGDTVRLAAMRGTNPWGSFEGQLHGDTMNGKGKQGGDEFTWDANRAPANTAPPKTHVFEPTQFHRVFSGSIAPVLHIQPGDTVKTTTVDAGGRDAKGVRRSMGGNPETGPFYVDGAMPGDTLVIRIDRLRLNRDTAGSGDRIVPSAVQPSYNRNAKFDDKFNAEWTLDREKGVAMLAKPTDRLKNFRVQLHPMLGCIGVAPPQNQSFRSGWLGPWGGNMDYNGLREGTTVYLPVFQEGALLFVGDGHALEGDGE
jgi:amidase